MVGLTHYRLILDCRVHNFKSFEIRVPSGIPEELHVGPLLHNMYVNDMAPCFLSSHFFVVADDLKLFQKKY